MTKRDECRNCQFSLFDPSTGSCKVCDFIQYRQRNRSCIGCSKSNCQYFCDTCGCGYHKKCAEKFHVKIIPLEENEVSVVCPSCEKEDSGNEVNCGGCNKEFSNEEAGLRMDQLLLVEYDMILYNAVVMDVNEKDSKVKIHFVKWSKSFDGWYQMDDERVNESLACDGCNKWFHIACLPQIKSTGRYKAASYVCETCFKEAKSSRTKGKPFPTMPVPSQITKSKEKERVRKVKSDNESNDEDENDVDEESDVEEQEDAITLSPSTLISLPPVPKRKVGRPSHKQLEAERIARAKRDAMLKSIKGKENSSQLSKTISPRSEVSRKNGNDRNKNDSKDMELSNRTTKSPRLREIPTKTNDRGKTSPPPPPPQQPPSPKRKAPTERHAPPPPPTSPKQRKTKPKSSPKVVASKSPPPPSTDEDSSSEEEVVRPVKKKKKLRDNQTETDLPLVSPPLPLQRIHGTQKSPRSNSSLILLSTLLNSPRYDKNNQENRPPRNVTPLDILHVVASQNIPPPPPPSSPPPPLPPGPAPPAAPVAMHGPESSLEYDMHYCLREEMYRRICEMEEGGLLLRETATLLRAWTHPTSPRFQDMRFVYLINRHADHLALRLSELTRRHASPKRLSHQPQYSSNIV